jgi:hypothetical protein
MASRLPPFPCRVAARQASFLPGHPCSDAADSAGAWLFESGVVFLGGTGGDGAGSEERAKGDELAASLAASCAVVREGVLSQYERVTVCTQTELRFALALE